MSALDAGVSGMLANQARMDTVGNNIANANTFGYKSMRAMFVDALYQVIEPANVADPQEAGRVEVEESHRLGEGQPKAGHLQVFAADAEEQPPGQGLGRRIVLILKSPAVEVLEREIRSGKASQVMHLADFPGHFIQRQFCFQIEISIICE